MKITLLLSIAAVLAATGCEKSSNPSSGTNASAMPANYLSSITRAQQTAVKTIDTTAVTQAVQLFQVDKGRLPKDLNELVQEKFLPKIPETPYGTRLDYNPATGEVKVVKQ